MTITLITGGNRGIGLETARQLVQSGHTVFIGARDSVDGERAANTVGARSVRLDVTDQISVNAALSTIEGTEGRLDLLVNNAGVFDDMVLDGDTASRVFDTNTVGVVRVTEAALPLLRRSSHPVVVNVSSSMGSFWAVNNPERPEYRMPAALYAASKAAVNMLTVQYAKAEPGIRFNAIEPGFTATSMTASLDGGRPAVDSARVVARAATSATAVSGRLLDEQGELPW
jgi:NAD(P)-dependent dehydrogenase (short-subunit alcohol dehydrogenase family)